MGSGKQNKKCNVHNPAKNVNTGGPGTHAWWWEIVLHTQAYVWLTNNGRKDPEQR